MHMMRLLLNINRSEILNKVDAVIFDWAGTIVDFGSVAPVIALKKTFDSFDVEVTMNQIRESMGKNKIEHIKDILSMDTSVKQWETLHNRSWDEDDVKVIYVEFEKTLLTILENETEFIVGVPEMFKQLRHQNIKVGSSTGYTRGMIDVVLNNIKDKAHQPDVVVTGSEVKNGRPFPDMINKNMEMMNLSDPAAIINIGDTIVDIESGKNAGVYSVGVLVGSSEMGLTHEEFENLSEEEKQVKIEETKKSFIEAGADNVITHITEITKLISELEGEK